MNQLHHQKCLERVTYYSFRHLSYTKGSIFTVFFFFFFFVCFFFCFFFLSRYGGQSVVSVLQCLVDKHENTASHFVLLHFFSVAISRFTEMIIVSLAVELIQTRVIKYIVKSNTEKTRLKCTAVG